MVCYQLTGLATALRNASKSCAATRMLGVAAILAFVSGASLAAQDGSLDTGFDPGTGPNSAVQAVAVQGDGKVLIGGNFVTVSGASNGRVARLGSNGSVDLGFSAGTGANSYTRATVQPDGKIMLVGGFTTVDGVTRNRIARLHSDGTLDTAFDPGTGADNAVYSAVMQPDGKVLIAGLFTTINGIARNRVARLLADGTLDATFNPGIGANGAVNYVALQPDGKVVIGGLFTAFDSVTRNRIARLNADGTLDAGFATGTGADSSVFWMAVQPDGKIVLCGGFTTVHGTARSRIARLLADGTLDLAFNPGTGPDNTVYSLALQPDGKVIIGGTFTSVDSVNITNIARVNADGTFDASFDPGTGANGLIQALALQPDGKVVLAGSFTAVNGVPRKYVARIDNPSIAQVLPVVTSTPTVTATAGQIYSYNITATGTPTPAISVSGLPSWLAFDNVDTISGTPAAADIGLSAQITVTATNSAGMDDQNFQIDVQGVPPTITSTALTTAMAGAPYSYTVTAIGEPTPAFSTGTLPGWLTFNAATGELSGTPTGADVGVSPNIDIIAANGWPPNAVQSFQITVNGAPPTITSTAPITAVADQPYTYTITATGNPAPSFSVSGNPAWLTLGGNVLSGTPTATDIGLTPTIIVTAFNGTAPDAVQSFQIAVDGIAPAFTSTPALTAIPKQPYNYTATASGTPAPTLTVTSALPAWLSFDAPTGTLSGTPSNGVANTSATVTIVAANGVSPDALQTFTIEVGKAVGSPPGADDNGGCAGGAGQATPSLALVVLAGLIAVRHSRRRRTPSGPPA